MTSVLPAAIERRTARVHGWLYRRSRGRFGASVGRDGRPVALLSTVGRRTGKAREWPLLCLSTDVGHVVVASNAGRDHDPAWLLNLRADPRAELQLGARRISVRAREASPEERDTLWPRLLEMHSGYADYQARTDRILPVVILEPAAGTPARSVVSSSGPS